MFMEFKLIFDNLTYYLCSTSVFGYVDLQCVYFVEENSIKESGMYKVNVDDEYVKSNKDFFIRVYKTACSAYGNESGAEADSVNWKCLDTIKIILNCSYSSNEYSSIKKSIGFINKDCNYNCNKESLLFSINNGLYHMP